MTTKTERPIRELRLAANAEPDPLKRRLFQRAADVIERDHPLEKPYAYTPAIIAAELKRDLLDSLLDELTAP